MRTRRRAVPRNRYEDQSLRLLDFFHPISNVGIDRLQEAEKIIG
jgi:hypothetical protein